eukprot:UN24995
MYRVKILHVQAPFRQFVVILRGQGSPKVSKHSGSENIHETIFLIISTSGYII